MHLRCHAARTVEAILSESSLDESKKQPLRAEFLRLSDAKQSQWIEVLSAIRDPGQRSAQALLLVPREDHLVGVGPLVVGRALFECPNYGSFTGAGGSRRPTTPLCPVVFLFGGVRVCSVDACGRAFSLLVVRSHRSSSPSGRSLRYVQAGCALRSLRPLEFCVCPLSRRAVWRVRAFGARCVRFVPLRGCRVRAGRVRRGSFGSIACVWFSAFSGSAWNREFCVFVWLTTRCVAGAVVRSVAYRLPPCRFGAVLDTIVLRS